MPQASSTRLSMSSIIICCSFPMSQSGSQLRSMLLGILKPIRITNSNQFCTSVSENIMPNTTGSKQQNDSLNASSKQLNQPIPERDQEAMESQLLPSQRLGSSSPVKDMTSTIDENSSSETSTQSKRASPMDYPICKALDSRSNFFKVCPDKQFITSNKMYGSSYAAHSAILVLCSVWKYL
jgi:hypothetical protein